MHNEIYLTKEGERKKDIETFAPLALMLYNKCEREQILNWNFEDLQKKFQQHLGAFVESLKIFSYLHFLSPNTAPKTE